MNSYVEALRLADGVVVETLADWEVYCARQSCNQFWQRVTRPIRMLATLAAWVLGLAIEALSHAY